MKRTKSTEKFETITINGSEFETTLSEKYRNRKPYQPADPNKVRAFIPGTVTNIYKKKGDQIQKGEKLLILEAMKMQNELLAPRDGIIKEIFVIENQVVPNKHILLEIE